MEGLIPLINKLQFVFKTTGMEKMKLPQIVVVGAQSSGKSSVLESLVKKSFLPRGTDMVTRCPIIIQLNQIKPEDREGLQKLNFVEPPEEWCRFSKTPERRYTDFDEVRRAIENLQVEMTLMAGVDKGISKEAIIVEVFSPNVIDLTVVDLPGIVKLPMKGQPDDIEDQVYDLIMSYVEDESAIILAVSAANVDIANSESIKIANKVDPKGDRTVAVVTKLDMMGKGTDATNVLKGDLVKVKLGIIGVVNRSQDDIKNNTSVEDGLRKEEEFLKKAYPHIPGVGSAYLAKRLNQLLTEHIHKNLPALTKRITVLSKSCEIELHGLGQEVSPSTCYWLIMETTSNFVKKFQEIVRYRPIDVDLMDANENDLFAVSATDLFKRLRDGIVIDDEKIDRVLIAKSLKKTLNFEGFSSIEEVFKAVVKKEITTMEHSAVECATEIHDLLSRTAAKCFVDHRLKFLNNKIKGVTDDILAEQLNKVKDGIQEYIQLQTRMIFSSDENVRRLIIKGPGPKVDERNVCPITAFPLTTDNSVPDENDHRIVHVHELIKTYLNVKKRELSDYIPQYLMYHLADKTIDKIWEATKSAIRGKESILVSEPEGIRMQRKEKQEFLISLQNASKIIRDVRYEDTSTTLQ